MTSDVPAEREDAPALYQRLFTERDNARKKQDRAGDRLGTVRLVLALVAVVLLLLPLWLRHEGPWWALAGLAFVFLWLGRWHDRVQTLARKLRAAAWYFQMELDRLRERWRVFEDGGVDLAPGPGSEPLLLHLSGDLDLFGRASVFQLLSRAVTPCGRETLARWLLHPAEVEESRARQVAVAELAETVKTREALYVAASGDGRAALHPDRLLAWAEEEQAMPFEAMLRIVGWLQPLLLMGAFVWYFFGGPGVVVAAAVILHIGTILATRPLVGARAGALAAPDRTLLRYADLIEVIEDSRFEAAVLARLKEKLQTPAQDRKTTASEQIRRLRRLVERLEWNHNMFFALSFGPILLWDLNVVLRAEVWRRHTGGRLRAWFETIGEIEALASLGAFAKERFDYAFPELTEEEGVFRAEKLMHPLIDRTEVVGNDLDLGQPGSVLILSGSNMSGKSTLLRSVGLAVLLARAGAPVPARSLKLSPFEIMTSIRVVDSLTDGTSHFYAELQRIKRTLDTAARAGSRLLYLLDEMLHGTNSRERYVGAVSVVRWMSGQSAIGIVTTHDLSVARVEGELPAGVVRNMHFGDQVVGEKIHFDYQLRLGPVQTTNALRLMRAIGIDIELSAPEQPEK